MQKNTKNAKNAMVAVAAVVATRGRPRMNDGKEIRLVPMRLTQAQYDAVMNLSPTERGTALSAGVRSNSALRKKSAPVA